MKIGFFITARLKSSRLKQKILLDINGKSVLDRVIERAKKVEGVDGVVLCTSINSQDSVLYNNAISNNIQFFAGSEDDVLERLLAAAKYYGYDAFVSITADNPLFSIYASNIMVDMYKRNQHDFIITKGLPIGCNTYLVDTKTLRVVNFMKKHSDTEVWGPFINRSDFFNVADLQVDNSPFKDNIRITLDYPEDYKFLRNIFSNFNPESIPSLIDVFDILKTKPELLKINSSRKQLAVPIEVLAEIDKEFESNKAKAKKFAKEIDKTLNPNYYIERIEM